MISRAQQLRPPTRSRPPPPDDFALSFTQCTASTEAVSKTSALTRSARTWWHAETDDDSGGGGGSKGRLATRGHKSRARGTR